jgi:fructose-1,6-bisphosphatase/sedoheptulose 1,7-bisphosphatase-like protein
LLEEIPNMKTRLEEDENKFDMCKIKVVDSEAVMTLASMFEEEDFVFEATTETRTRFKSRLSL